MYSMDCLVGVVRMLVFPVCGYDEMMECLPCVKYCLYIFIYMCVCVFCAFVGLYNTVYWEVKWNVAYIFTILCLPDDGSYNAWPKHVGAQKVNLELKLLCVQLHGICIMFNMLSYTLISLTPLCVCVCVWFCECSCRETPDLELLLTRLLLQLLPAYDDYNSAVCVKIIEASGLDGICTSMNIQICYLYGP